MTPQIDLHKEEWAHWALFTLNSLFHHKAALVEALTYAPNSHTFDDVCQMVLSGKNVLWQNKRSFLITEITTYPQTRVCHLFLAGGYLDELIEMHPTIIEYAKLYECTSLTLSGRPGWLRALKQYGWSTSLASVKLPFDGREERYGRQGWRSGNGHANGEDGTAEVDRGRSQDEPSDSERSGGDPISA